MPEVENTINQPQAVIIDKDGETNLPYNVKLSRLKDILEKNILKGVDDEENLKDIFIPKAFTSFGISES